MSNAIRCPLCRRSVSLIVEDAARVKSTDEKIKLYNWKFGRQCSWADYIRDIPIIVRLLLRDIWHSVIVGVRDPNTGTDFLAFFAFLFVHILLYLSSFSFVAFILTILVVFIPLFFHILFIQIDTD